MLKTTKNDTTIETPWMRPTEACQYIRVSRKTLEKYRKEGFIRFYLMTPAGTTFYRRDDLDEFLLSREVLY